MDRLIVEVSYVDDARPDDPYRFVRTLTRCRRMRGEQEIDAFDVEGVEVRYLD